MQAFVLFPRSVTISQTLTPSPLHLSPHWQWPVTVVVSTVLARRQTRQLRLAAHCTHCTVTRLHPSPLPTTSSPPPLLPPPPTPPFPWHHMHCLMQWSMCWLFFCVFFSVFFFVFCFCFYFFEYAWSNDNSINIWTHNMHLTSQI